MPDLSRWTDRVALVTGASSGIGEAVAVRLVHEGMRVIGCARRLDRMQHLRDRLGARFVPMQADLRDPTAIEALFASLDAQGLIPAVLVNNAGLASKDSLLDGQREGWREMFDVNVLALCQCTQRAVRGMRAHGDDGAVVHISSMAGHRVPVGGNSVYAATKFAVRALTEGLRQELYAAGSGVRVSAVSPGLVETEFPAVYHGSAAAAALAAADFPILHPADVADAVAWILSQPAHVQVHDVLLRPRRQPS
jgi:NADP-dependent 3-hydroxy acid dehydrogenase YdfG